MGSVMLRLLIACFALTVAWQFAAAGENVLTPVTECPLPQGHYDFGECEVLGLQQAGAGEGLRTEPGRKHVVKRFPVTGSLNDGKPKRYVLQFKQPVSDYFAFTDRSGPIAVDRREADLTVLTTQGSLRISKGVSIEDPPNVVLIDARRWSVIARYYTPCLTLSFMKRRDAIWDAGRKRCVSMRPNGDHSTFAGSCAKPTKCTPYELPKGLVPARDVRLEQVEESVRDLRDLRLSTNSGGKFGGMGWGVEAYRAPGTPYIVLWGYCGDCDE